MVTTACSLRLATRREGEGGSGEGGGGGRGVGGDGMWRNKRELG